MDENEIYSITVEVWVKPLWRKARPKEFSFAWVAGDLSDLYRQLNSRYAGKRWKLKHCGVIDREPYRRGKRA